MKYKKLYKKDTKGKTRVWWAERQGSSYRFHSGIIDGKIVTSGWKSAAPKNLGKSNQTNAMEQAEQEIASLYKKQMEQGKYTDNQEKIELGCGFFEVMLAQTFEPKKHNDYPYVINPKLDGIRCVARKEGLFTRTGKSIVAVPHIQNNLKDFFDKYPNVILDGELYNHQYKHDFEKIVSIVRKTKPKASDIQLAEQVMQFHVYDCFFPDDKDMGYKQRWYNLREKLTLNDSIRLIEIKIVRSLNEIENEFAQNIEDGYEGVMVRKPNSPYENKRSKNLLKYKDFGDDEFMIVDIIEGVGNWSGYAKSIKIQLPDGQTQNSGMRGDFSFAREVLNKKDKLIGTQVTVRFQGKTNDNQLRMPVVTKFWLAKRLDIE